MRKIIFPIIIAGAILRFWYLGKWSFWADEVFTTLDAQQFPHILRISPIPYAVVKFFISIFGTSEWSARLGPAIFGIAAIPIIYLIASQMFSVRVGLISSLLVAFLPWHLFWSQNARSYSFTFLFSLISAGMFFLAFERDKLSLLLGSLFFYLLLVMSHLLSGVLLFSFIAYVGCLKFLPVENPSGFRRRNLVVFFAPFILPLLALAHPKLFHFLVSGWGHNVWERSPLYVLFTLVYGLTIPIAVLAGAFGFIYILSTASGLKSLLPPLWKRAEGGIGVRHILNPFNPSLSLSPRRGDATATPVDRVLFPNRAVLFLLCYALAPLIFFLISSTLQNVAGYYLFFTVPAYILLVAVFCGSLPQRALTYILVFVLLAEMAGLNYLYFSCENGGRPMWREAFALVRNEMEEGDVLVCTLPRIAGYYLPEANTHKINEILVKADEAQGLNHFSFRLQPLAFRTPRARVWFVWDEPTMSAIDPSHKMRRWIQERSRLLRRYPVYTRASDRSVNVFLAENLQ